MIYTCYFNRSILFHLSLQVVFKFFFSPQTEKNRDIVRRSGLLLWQLLMAPADQISSEIQKEVCLAIRCVVLSHGPKPRGSCRPVNYQC